MPSEIDKLRPAGTALAPPRPLGWRPTRAPIEWSGRLFSISSFSRASPSITLGLVGGQRLLRDATARLLAVQDGLEVLGTFESVADFLSIDFVMPPAIILLDCDGSDRGSCQNAVETLSAHQRSGLIMLCRDLREEVVRCAIEHRVSGVVLKSFSVEDMMAAIKYMATGRTVMPAGWQRAIAAPAEQRLRLSPRHRQILALIALGRRNEEIAGELGLSQNTIKFHIQALYLRLEVRNRVQAANQYAQIIGDGD